MNTFLNQPEATFYHITTIERWNEINQNGINVPSGRIFVSRVGELPVLLAIAFEQLPEIYETESIAVIKMPQARNNFQANEIIRDNQAGVEWTQPFQNIILRKIIPRENLELMTIIRLGQEPQRTFTMTYLTQIANDGQANYQEHFITQRANQLNY